MKNWICIDYGSIVENVSVSPSKWVTEGRAYIDPNAVIAVRSINNYEGYCVIVMNSGVYYAVQKSCEKMLEEIQRAL